MSCLPFWNILRVVALLAQLIVDQSQLTSLLSWSDSVQTNIELGAVLGVSVLRVRIKLTKVISGGVGGALEPISGLQSWR